MVFSQRYKDLIEYGNGESKDFICGEIDYTVKRDVVDCLLEFDEPFIMHPYRYDQTYEVESSALEQALIKLNKHIGLHLYTDGFDLHRNRDIIASTFTPHLFDIIEFQYEELSEKEKNPFEKAISSTFDEHSIPWLMANGKLVKIDAKQFELDLRNKTLMSLHELNDSDPKFQAAYDELIRACEFLERDEYGEAISNAGKSYESILKVICDVQKGNADKLTKEYIATTISNLPASMTSEGFREKVLMSLPFIRNNSASDHGAGATPAIVSKPLAKLAINLASALNTYLIEEYSCSIHLSEDGTSTGGEIDDLPF